MAKTWEQLSDAEKIEDLRSDLLRIIAKVNQLDAHSDVLERGISKIAGDLRDLESGSQNWRLRGPRNARFPKKVAQPSLAVSRSTTFLGCHLRKRLRARYKGSARAAHFANLATTASGWHPAGRLYLDCRSQILLRT